MTSPRQLARSPGQIGAAIRRRRKQLKLSQSDLGEMSGLRQETISLLETGNPGLRLDTLLKLLAALDLELQIAPRTKLAPGDVENRA